jgi:hypothetical protein
LATVKIALTEKDGKVDKVEKLTEAVASLMVWCSLFETEEFLRSRMASDPRACFVCLKPAQLALSLEFPCLSFFLHLELLCHTEGIEQAQANESHAN